MWWLPSETNPNLDLCIAGSVMTGQRLRDTGLSREEKGKEKNPL